MQQIPLIHEDWREALRYDINALGGPGEVGYALRPALPRKDSRSWVSNCLNPDRAEKFDLEDVRWILREARKIGCHAGMSYLAQDAGYSAMPIAPEDEQDELMRQFIEAQKAMAAIVRRMDTMQVRVRPGASELRRGGA